MKGHQDGWGLEQLSCEEHLRALGLLSWEKGWLQEDPTAVPMEVFKTQLDQALSSLG